MITIAPLPITYFRARALFFVGGSDDPMKRKIDPAATRKHLEDQQHEDAASNPGVSKPDEFFVLMTQKLKELDAKITGLAREIRELRRRDRKRK